MVFAMRGLDGESGRILELADQTRRRLRAGARIGEIKTDLSYFSLELLSNASAPVSYAVAGV